jgi:hypothetical protein
MQHSLVSASTASGDTTKTLIDTVTMPAGAKQIIGVAFTVVGGAGLTTLEDVTGILELESSDFPNFMPQQFLMDEFAVLASGVGALSPRIYPMNIPCRGSERISIYATMDMALTVNSKIRAMFVYLD